MLRQISHKSYSLDFFNWKMANVTNAALVTFKRLIGILTTVRQSNSAKISTLKNY